MFAKEPLLLILKDPKEISEATLNLQLYNENVETANKRTSYTMGVFAPTTDLDEIYTEGSPTYSSSYDHVFDLTMTYAVT